MKSNQEKFVPRKLVVAVQLAMTALVAPAAYADVAVEEFTTPEQTAQVGAIYTSRDSYKFGEYNGLPDRGYRADLNFSLVGKGKDDNSLLYWKAEGSNLGLDTRRLEVEGGQQGKFNVKAFYDELTHQISDSYQTIFLGTGSTALTLPSSYPAIASRLSNATDSTASGKTTYNSLANWANIQSPNAAAVNSTTGTIVNNQTGPAYVIPALMHNFNVATKRSTLGGEFSVEIAPGWDARFGVREEHKDGSKLTGFAFASASTAAMLVEPVQYRTNTYEGTVNYKSEKATASVTYSYSTFRNAASSWTAATPFATGSVLNNQALLAGPPANEMQQLTAKGTYRIDPKNRFSYELSAASMTQNAMFNYQSGTGWSVPVSSAGAKVNTESMVLRLNSRPTSNLVLNGSWKYDNRDNQTPVRTYRVAFADSATAPTASGDITNDPINTRKNLVNLDGEYTVSRGHTVKASYGYEKIDRGSDGNGAAPSRTTTVNGSTANSNDFTLPVHVTKENTFGLEYRNTALENITGRLAYSWSERRAKDYSSPSFAATTNNLQPLTNAYYAGFRDYFVADRNRDRARVNVNWQANDQWSFGMTAEYNRDDYANAALTSSKTSSVTLDANFTPSENLTLSPYYTYEDRKSSLTGVYIIGSTANANVSRNNTVTSYTGCTATTQCILANWTWGLDQADKVHTLGLSGKFKGAMGGKLELKGDILYIQSNTPVTAKGGGTLTSDGATTPTYLWLAPASFPDITSRTVQVKLQGDYKVNKTSTVRVAYQYTKLVSSDWQYDAYTNPVAMQTYIGTGMTSSNYTVNAVGVSYVHKFQ